MNPEDFVSEFQLLGFAVLLGFVQLAWAAIAARQQQGLKWALGPRDEHKPVKGVAARLDRAFRNYMETFPLFAVAVLAAYMAQKTSWITAWGCLIYVSARVIYVPLYAAGVPRVRSYVWGAAVLGLLMVVAALFLPVPEGTY